MNATKIAKVNKKTQEKEMVKAVKAQQLARAKMMEEAKADADFLRPILRDNFWPILRGKTVDEVSTICQVVAGRMSEYFLKIKGTMKVSDLHLEELFKDNDEAKVVEVLKDLTLNQAEKIVSGMNQAIDACIRREQKTRKIIELTELVSEFE